VTTPATGPAAASGLLEQKEQLSQRVTQALYAEFPDLLEKHGERGRGKCLQDMRYNIDFLASAVDLESPEEFARYVRWLDDMLRSRGVGTRDVRRCLELLRDAADSAIVSRVIDAGLAVLAG
jgi:hypothetical protein